MTSSPLRISLILAVICAGGRSSRFGGEKALATFQGERLLDRAIRIAVTAGFEPLVSLDRPSRFGRLPCPELVDTVEGIGPLGALVTAFELYPDRPVLIMPCDMPLLGVEQLRLLAESQSEQEDVVAYSHPERGLLPLPALYAQSCASKAALQRQGGDYALRRLLATLQVKGIQVGKQDARCFVNVNTQEELRSLAESSDAGEISKHSLLTG